MPTSKPVTSVSSREFNQDTGVGAIVLTGAGRGFCAGADVRDWSSNLGAGRPAMG